MRLYELIITEAVAPVGATTDQPAAVSQTPAAPGLSGAGMQQLGSPAVAAANLAQATQQKNQQKDTIRKQIANLTKQIADLNRQMSSIK